MNIRSKWDTPTIALVVCAVLMVAMVARREFFAPRVAAGRAPAGPPIAVPSWEAITDSGHRMGPPNAVVKILVFADFECPACRGFATSTLAEVRRAYPNDVAVYFRHWPLSYHKFALPAARAAECAAKQGRFEAIHDVLYAKQDSLGLKSFQSFALEAAVPDAPAFEACNSDVTIPTRVTGDATTARQVGGTGTPTVIVNGWLQRVPPDRAFLDSVVVAARNR